MQIKRITIAVALTAALTAVIILNQNMAKAQGGSSAPSCMTISTPAGSHTTIDQMKAVACGYCTLYSVRSGWTPEDGLGAKYESYEVAAAAPEVTCKSTGSNVTCTAVAVLDQPTCPLPPEDLRGTDGSTGSGTGTGSN